MKISAFKTTQTDKSSLILILDKVGVIGEAIAQELSKDFLIFLVSARPLSSNNKRIIHVPLKKRIPQVPDNNYSKIFIVDYGDSITWESAFSFIEKAREIDIPLYFIGSIRNVDIENADDISS